MEYLNIKSPLLSDNARALKENIDLGYTIKRLLCTAAKNDDLKTVHHNHLKRLITFIPKALLVIVYESNIIKPYTMLKKMEHSTLVRDSSKYT